MNAEAHGQIEGLLKVMSFLGLRNDEPKSNHIHDQLKAETGFKIVCRVYGNRVEMFYTFPNGGNADIQKATTPFKDTRNRILDDAFKEFPFKLLDCFFHEFENGTLILPLTPEFGGPYVG